MYVLFCKGWSVFCKWFAGIAHLHNNCKPIIVKPMHSLTVYQPSLSEYIHTDFETVLLDNQCLFSEGPVWNAQGFYLFSDIPANAIYKVIPGQQKEVYLHKSGCTNEAEAEHEQLGSNGLAYDAQGNLWVCQHGNHAVACYKNNVLEPVVTAYQNKPLNSPNDIVVHRNGSVFFSDPPYGLNGQQPNPGKYQPQAGVYCWREGKLQQIWAKLQYPNGVCLSPDEQSLFVCSHKPFEKTVLEFDAESGAFKREVCKEISDGIKCDRSGNLYLCSKEGVIIVNQQGERMGLISLPTQPANCCWGGADGTDLFITARENLFLLRNLQRI